MERRSKKDRHRFPPLNILEIPLCSGLPQHNKYSDTLLQSVSVEVSRVPYSQGGEWITTPFHDVSAAVLNKTSQTTRTRKKTPKNNVALQTGTSKTLRHYYSPVATVQKTQKLCWKKPHFKKILSPDQSRNYFSESHLFSATPSVSECDATGNLDVTENLKQKENSICSNQKETSVGTIKRPKCGVFAHFDNHLDDANSDKLILVPDTPEHDQGMTIKMKQHCILKRRLF